MAFAFAIPAIGSAVLPAIGTVASGLGGALASGAGALGSALSTIPVIGAPIGGAIGSLGSGLGGSLGALGAGNIGGALSSLGSGALGAGSNLLSGVGGLYAGADKLAGGLLPNLGIGGTITPSQGYLGGLFPQSGAAAQGPQIPLSQQFQSFLDGGAPVSQANIDAGLTQMGAGGQGGLNFGKVMDLMGTIGKEFGSEGAPGVTQKGVNTMPVNGQPAGPTILPNSPGNNLRNVQLAPGPGSAYAPYAPPAIYNDKLDDADVAKLEVLNAKSKGPADSLQNMYGRASSIA